MGKIFCVMGKSATGKDTIYQKLLNERELFHIRRDQSEKEKFQGENIISVRNRMCRDWRKRAES